MPTRLRIATFNLENLDDQPNQHPTLVERIALMGPQLARLDADILCLQEVNAHKTNGQFQLTALDQFLAGTPYATYHQAAAFTPNGSRSLVIFSRFPVTDQEQVLHPLAPAPSYRRVTAIPADTAAHDITWERPTLRAVISLDATRVVQVVNVHLKSKLATDIPGQKVNPADQFSPFRTASGWAEGSFLSSMKRVGQALETRMLLDRLFDTDPQALIVVCGDFNSDATEVPLAAIKGEVEDNDNPALAARTMVACEQTVPEQARYSLIHHGKGQMLDHVLVCRALLAFYSHTEIHNELLHDESSAFATDIKFPESDHAPVVAEFTLPD